MGNLFTKSKILTSQEFLTFLEKRIVTAMEIGEYGVFVTTDTPVDAVSAVLRRLVSEGFDVVSGKLATGGRFVCVGWRKSTAGRAKICREKSDMYWNTKTSELEWKVLKGEDTNPVEEEKHPIETPPLVLTPEESKQYESFRWTPLHMVTFKKDLQLMNLYITSGANLEASDIHNDKPIHWCVSVDNLEGLLLLLKAGANINSKGNQGWTALHYAYLQNRQEFIRVLLQNGADPNILDDKGRTPINCKN